MVATRRCRRAILAVLVALAIAVPLPSSGSLAAPSGIEVLGTMPAADDAVARPPEVARVVFSVPVEPVAPAVEVVDAAGARVDAGDAGQGPSPLVVEVPLPEDLPAGEYTARWQVRAADGDELSGSWRFAVTEDPEGGGPGALPLVALVLLVLTAAGWWLARRRLG